MYLRFIYIYLFSFFLTDIYPIPLTIAKDMKGNIPTEPVFGIPV